MQLTFKHIAAVILLLLVFGSNNVGADENGSSVYSQSSTKPPKSAATSQKQTGQNSKIPCTCRFQGRSHKLGTVACIRTAKGNPVQARCQMSLNNTAWKFSDTPCTPDDPTS